MSAAKLSHGVAYLGDIDVGLFDRRYTATFHRINECRAFLKGVETVLNHMIPATSSQQQESDAA
jgi:hypothetical protein